MLVVDQLLELLADKLRIEQVKLRPMCWKFGWGRRNRASPIWQVVRRALLRLQRNLGDQRR